MATRTHPPLFEMRANLTAWNLANEANYSRENRPFAESVKKHVPTEPEFNVFFVEALSAAWIMY